MSELRSCDGNLRNVQVNCTSCANQINHNHKGTILKHAALGVIVCKRCSEYYGNGIFSQDENGIDEFCRWCAEGGSLICCDHCSNVFCKNCIRRNLGRKELSVVTSDKSWQCYCCDPSTLAELHAFYERVYKYNQLKKEAKGIKPLTVNKNATFPDVELCVASVSEGSKLFEKNIRSIQKMFRQDVTSGENSWSVIKKLRTLLKMQQQNVESLRNMVKSVDLTQLKTQVKVERRLAKENKVEKPKAIKIEGGNINVKKEAAAAPKEKEIIHLSDSDDDYLKKHKSSLPNTNEAKSKGDTEEVENNPKKLPKDNDSESDVGGMEFDNVASGSEDSSEIDQEGEKTSLRHVKKVISDSDTDDGGNGVVEPEKEASSKPAVSGSENDTDATEIFESQEIATHSQEDDLKVPSEPDNISADSNKNTDDVPKPNSTTSPVRKNMLDSDAVMKDNEELPYFDFLKPSHVDDRKRSDNEAETEDSEIKVGRKKPLVIESEECDHENEVEDSETTISRKKPRVIESEECSANVNFEENIEWSDSDAEAKHRKVTRKKKIKDEEAIIDDAISDSDHEAKNSADGADKNKVLKKKKIKEEEEEAMIEDANSDSDHEAKKSATDKDQNIEWSDSDGEKKPIKAQKNEAENEQVVSDIDTETIRKDNETAVKKEDGISKHTPKKPKPRIELLSLKLNDSPAKRKSGPREKKKKNSDASPKKKSLDSPFKVKKSYASDSDSSCSSVELQSTFVNSKDVPVEITNGDNNQKDVNDVVSQLVGCVSSEDFNVAVENSASLGSESYGSDNGVHDKDDEPEPKTDDSQSILFEIDKELEELQKLNNMLNTIPEMIASDDVKKEQLSEVKEEPASVDENFAPITHEKIKIELSEEPNEHEALSENSSESDEDLAEFKKFKQRLENNVGKLEEAKAEQAKIKKEKLKQMEMNDIAMNNLCAESSDDDGERKDSSSDSDQSTWSLNEANWAKLKVLSKQKNGHMDELQSISNLGSFTDPKIYMPPLVKVNKISLQGVPDKGSKNPLSAEDKLDRQIDNLLHVPAPKIAGESSNPKSKKDSHQKRPKDQQDDSDSSINDSGSDLDLSNVDKIPEKLNVDLASKNENAQMLLEDSHDSLFSDDSSDDEKKKSKGKNKTSDGEKNKKDQKSGTDDDADTKPKKKGFQHAKLLQMKFSSSSSSDEEAKNIKKSNSKSRKKKKKKSKIDCSDSETQSSSSDSDISLISPKKKSRKPLNSDSDDFLMKKPSFLSDDSKDSFDMKKKISKRKMKSSSSSDDNSNDKKPKKKRSRIKVASDSEGSVVEDSPSKGSQRRNIRKLMSKNRLADETKEAAKAERERRRRVMERQKLYYEVTEKINDHEIITKKLVLQTDQTTHEELVFVNPQLVGNLKPHQVEAVKFLWECTVESIEHAKEPGAGCILAHCMGLGKTLSVISYIHTVMNCEQLPFERCLVVSPLNTVLNWQNEFNKWLTNHLEIQVFVLALQKRNDHRAYMLERWFEDGGVCIIGYEMYRSLLQNKRNFTKKMLKTFNKTLLDPGPDIIVCDEGHVIKNDKTSLSKTLNRVRTLRRIVLTGTPLQNNLKEYHCMLSFVKPRLLGTFKEFANRFMNPIMNGQCADSNARDVKLMKKRIHVLFNLLNGCVQSRDYSCLTKVLTPKFEYVIHIRLSEMQLKLYQHYLDNRQSIRSGKSSAILRDFIIFQLISNHPWLLHLSRERKLQNEFVKDTSESSMSEESSSSDSSSDTSDDHNIDKDASKKLRSRTEQLRNEKDGESSRDSNDSNPKIDMTQWWAKFMTDEDELNPQLSGKIILLFSILAECEAIGDKVLVFSQSLLSLDLIEHCLHKAHEDNAQNEAESQFEYKTWLHGVDYFRLDGQTNAEKRLRMSNSFNDEENPRGRLFLISTKAGSLGINLVSANRVIIFDASWNPSHDLQAIFRAYRFGQVKPVYIYRFLAQGTMEEKVYDRQIMKQSMSFRVMDEKTMDRHFTHADLMELYSFNPESKSKHSTPLVPKDRLLAELLIREKDSIVSYHEHDSLLQSVTEEDLTEEERQAAWAEYEAEKKGLWDAVTGTLGPGQGEFDIDAVMKALRDKKPNMTQEELTDNLERFIRILKEKQLKEQQEQHALQMRLAQQRSAQLQAQLQSMNSNRIVRFQNVRHPNILPRILNPQYQAANVRPRMQVPVFNIRSMNATTSRRAPVPLQNVTISRLPTAPKTIALKNIVANNKDNNNSK